MFPDEIRDKTQLHQFLGCINYIVPFYLQLVGYMKLLNQKLKKNHLAWLELHTECVKRNKEKCQHLPPLKLHSEGRKNIYIDASDEHWGAVLTESFPQGYEEIC